MKILDSPGNSILDSLLAACLGKCNFCREISFGVSETGMPILSGE
jgi:hypothetical protein